MKKFWCMASAIGLAALICPWAAAQNDDRDDSSDSSYEQRERRSYERGRTSQTDQSRRSTSQRSGRDANSQADSNDSWSEWISDWWSDDSETGQSQAGDHSASGGNRMKTGVQGFVRRHDNDDDGYLSRQELPSNLREGFEDLDRDSDGYLTASELRQHAQKAMSQQSPVVVTYVWVLDTNEGRVRLNDLQQAYEALQEVDQDGDGEISRQEVRQRQQKVATRFIDKCFQQHDENDDDQISREEARGSNLAGRFKRLDRNSDDRLTRSELKQSLQTSSGASQQGSSQSESASRGQDREDRERR